MAAASRDIFTVTKHGGEELRYFHGDARWAIRYRGTIWLTEAQAVECVNPIYCKASSRSSFLGGGVIVEPKLVHQTMPVF